MVADQVLLLHLLATCFMAGVIWVVQLVHYPLFAHVDRMRFASFEHSHQQRISRIVVPAMLLELGTGVLWLWITWNTTGHVTFALANAALILTIWVVTAVLSVPQHARLALGFDAEAHRRLVSSNWVRTTLWSTRSLLLATFFLSTLS